MKFPSHLKVATTLGATSFVANTKNGTVMSGIDIKFLNILADKLNFKYTVHLPTDGGTHGSVDKNGRWTGVVGMLERGEADMSALYTPITEEKTYVVDYSTAYYTLEKTFANDIPHPLPRYNVLLLPFQVDVWITIVISFLLVPNILQQLMFGKQSMSAFFTNLFNGRKVPDDIRRSFKRRALHGSWLVFQTVLRFTYTSVFLSFLTVRPIPRGIKTIPELADAIEKGNYRFYVPRGSVNMDFLINSDSENFKKIGLAIKRHDWQEVLDYKNETIGDSKAIEGARAIFHIMYGKPPFSTVSIAEDSFGIWSSVIMFKKDFCCEDALNTVILRISSGGLYQKIIDDEAFRQQFKLFFRKSPHERVEKISLEELSGIFFLLVSSYILSLLSLMIERSHFRCHRFTKSK